jgi:uncharacterized protein (DUF362 family)
MPRVILRRCDDYDPDHIRGIIGECIDELGFRPRGRTLVKPNTVIAHRELFQHAFTRAELLDGLLGALRQRGEGVTELTVGERCGITIPTRYAFAEAGYLPVLRRHGVPARYFDEMPQVPVTLERPGRLRDTLFVPQAVAEADTFITVPKFKAHPWTKVTFNLKLYIGIQDDAHRLIDHDHHLHTKIADLFEVIQPRLCVVDAIIAGGKTMLTPTPFPLGLIIVGDDAVSTDVVCTHIAGLDPREVHHIRITAERGWGSLRLEDVRIDGDVTLDEARARARDFELTLEPIDRQFNGRSNLTVHLGPPPDTYDYCWGGCPGALTEAVGIIERLQPDMRRAIRPLRLVYGAYQGEIAPAEGERVLVVGDCARWQGTIGGESVTVPYLYRDRHLLRPEQARGIDLVVKLVTFVLARFLFWRKRVVRTRGCTVSVAETVLLLAWYGRVTNPYFDRRLVFGFTWSWLLFRLARTWSALRAALFPPRLRPRTSPTAAAPSGPGTGPAARGPTQQ